MTIEKCSLSPSVRFSGKLKDRFWVTVWHYAHFWKWHMQSKKNSEAPSDEFGINKHTHTNDELRNELTIE